MKYVLQAKEQLTATSLVLTFAPAGLGKLEFAPGQYVSVRFWRFGKPTPARCFSIVNAPDGLGHIQLGVRVSGQFTRRLQELSIGSQVELDGPFGSFVYDAELDQTSVFIAGGIGITPIMSLLRTYAPLHPTHSFSLIYSVRSQADVPFMAELLKLEQHYQNVHITVVVTRDSDASLDGLRVTKGPINTVLLEKVVPSDFAGVSYFICGPDGFTERILTLLRTHNPQALHINIESFDRVSGSDTALTFGLAHAVLRSVYALTALAVVAVMSVISITAASKSSTTSTTSTTTTQDTNEQSSNTGRTNTDDTSNTDTYNEPSQQTYQEPMSTVS